MNEQLSLIFQNPTFYILILIWNIFWKGLSLWQSASRKHLPWFMMLLVINTMGLLEIAYILYLHKWNIDNGKLLEFINKNIPKPKQKK